MYGLGFSPSKNAQCAKKIKVRRLDFTIFEYGIGQHCLNLKWVEATMQLDSSQVRYLDYSVSNMRKLSPLMCEVTWPHTLKGLGLHWQVAKTSMYTHGSSLPPLLFGFKLSGFNSSLGFHMFTAWTMDISVANQNFCRFWVAIIRLLWG